MPVVTILPAPTWDLVAVWVEVAVRDMVVAWAEAAAWAGAAVEVEAWVDNRYRLPDTGYRMLKCGIVQDII